MIVVESTRGAAVATCTVDMYVGCIVKGTKAKPTKFTKGHTEQSLIHVVRKVRLTSAKASLYVSVDSYAHRARKIPS